MYSPPCGLYMLVVIKVIVVVVVVVADYFVNFKLFSVLLIQPNALFPSVWLVQFFRFAFFLFSLLSFLINIFLVFVIASRNRRTNL